MPEKFSKVTIRIDWPEWVFEIITWMAVAVTGALHVCGHLFDLPLLRALSGLAFTVLVYGSFIEPRILTVKRFEVGKGERSLAIAYLSDLHAGAYKKEGFFRRVAKKTASLKPDLVLLGGDYVLNRGKDAAMLAPLDALRPRLGIFASLGNHDDYYERDEVLKAFAKMPHIRLLVNEAARIPLDGRMLAISAVDDDWFGDTQFRRAVAGVMPEDLLIMLIHNPEVASHAAKETGIKPALMLSGHDHGGQIRLPFIGALLPPPHNLGRKYVRGLFDFDGAPLIIGQGVGESGPRARLFCPPQIVHVTLKY